jgi:hypothetical protein
VQVSSSEPEKLSLAGMKIAIQPSILPELKNLIPFRFRMIMPQLSDFGNAGYIRVNTISP